jgi:phosphoribosyl-AMP cyclohydrolase
VAKAWDTYYVGGKPTRLTKKALEKEHVHHWWFKCLRGSDESKNLIYMQVLVHTGRKESIHWHVIRYMNSTAVPEGVRLGQSTFKALMRKWNKGRLNLAQKTAFKNAMRAAYRDYFSLSKDCEEIMKLVDAAIDAVP